MNIEYILAELDREINRLQQARDLLSGPTAENPRGRGRPKGSKNNPKDDQPGTSGKRSLSAEGKRRIAEAQKPAGAAKKSQNSGQPQPEAATV